MNNESAEMTRSAHIYRGTHHETGRHGLEQRTDRPMARGKTRQLTSRLFFRPVLADETETAPSDRGHGPGFGLQPFDGGGDVLAGNITPDEPAAAARRCNGHGP